MGEKVEEEVVVMVEVWEGKLEVEKVEIEEEEGEEKKEEERRKKKE